MWLCIVFLTVSSGLVAVERPRLQTTTITIMDDHRVNMLIDNKLNGINLEGKVRQVIQTELFWRDFFETFSKSESKRDLERNLHEVINKRFADFEVRGAKTMISQAILDTMPSYLNDNVKMKKLLSSHKDKMVQELEATARQVIGKIANEDTYHTMQSQVRQAAETRSNQLQSDLQANYMSQLQTQSGTFNTFIEQLKQKNAREMETFNTINTKVEELNSKLFYQTVAVGITSVLLGGCFIALFMK